MKKPILLFLALLLPACIFIFLKKFGKNEFDVPAFYQTEKPQAPDGCSFTYSAPFLVSDTLMSKLRSSGAKAFYLVVYADLQNLSRVAEQYNDEVKLMDLRSTTNEIKSCAFLMKEYQDVILIDDKAKIRGYYTSTDREEVDRLLLELDILLTRYSDGREH